MNTVQEKILDRYIEKQRQTDFQKRFEEVKHNPDRLVNLQNDYYLSYKLEIDLGIPQYRGFYEKVVNQLETVAV